jgi:hypothetical protein
MSAHTTYLQEFTMKELTMKKASMCDRLNKRWKQRLSASASHTHLPLGLTAPALALALLAMATAADARPIVVVPGGNAGYLYFPAGGGGSQANRQQVFVIKEGGFTGYTLTSDPAGIACDQNCPNAEGQVNTGVVKIRLLGQWREDGVNIPMFGDFTGACEATGASECTFALTATAPATVRVEVKDKAPRGAPMTLPTGGQVRYAGYVNGKHMVAAHTALVTKRWLGSQTSTGATNLNDGAANTAVLVSHPSNSADAAKYCAELNSETLGGGWYLPARDELALLVSWPNAVLSSMGLSERTWASTDKESEKAWAFEFKPSENKKQMKDAKKTDSHSTLCMKPYNP